METSIAQIAALVGGKVIGDDSQPITGVNGIEEAGQGELAFMDHPKYRAVLERTAATAVLVPLDVTTGPTTLIQVEAPRLAFALVLALFDQDRLQPLEGVHPMAAIGRNVCLGKDVAIDAFVRIGDNASIGDRTVIHSGSYVGRGSTIGPDGLIHPNVTVREDVHIGARCILHSGAILGSDGFGFAQVDGVQHKIPQVGSVVLGDDVEVGSNTCIDRATFGKTVIGNGTKIDNLVQIGHNVRIGDQCVVSGMAGISGSTQIGNRVTVGGNAGFAGHLSVGDDVVIGARAGVTKSIPAGKIVSGFPAIDHSEARRIRASFRRLPDALRRIKELETRLYELERHLHGEAEDDR